MLAIPAGPCQILNADTVTGAAAHTAASVGVEFDVRVDMLAAIVSKTGLHHRIFTFIDFTAIVNAERFISKISLEHIAELALSLFCSFVV